MTVGQFCSTALFQFSYTIGRERLNLMKEIINTLNKHSLAEATGISYSRLRKYSAGAVAELTEEERRKIYEYLLSIADAFKIT